MSVAPIQKSKSSTGSLNTSSTSLVISKESGVTLVHPDGKELPESFEYAKPKKLPGRYLYIDGFQGSKYHDFSSTLVADWMWNLCNFSNYYCNHCTTSHNID